MLAITKPEWIHYTSDSGYAAQINEISLLTKKGLQMKMTAAQVNDYILSTIPIFKTAGCHVEAVVDDPLAGGCITVRQPYNEGTLRAGGSISGPTMMALADTAMYALILASLGPIGLAVTQNLKINFLRKPRDADLIASARFLRLGKRAAVIDVLIHAGDDSEPVAQATGTYAIPAA